jgi:hypothetical protein
MIDAVEGEDAVAAIVPDLHKIINEDIHALSRGRRASGRSV